MKPTYINSKRITLLLVTIIVLATAAVAQEKTVPKDLSKLEEFSVRSGRLLEKKFIDVGKVGGVKIQVLSITDMVSKIKISGVKFGYNTFDRYASEKTAFLDSDEVDDLVKTVTIIKSQVLPTTPSDYTEVVYSSRSGFSAGCFYAKDGWQAFLKLEKYDSNSLVSLKVDALDQIITMLEQAKTKF